MLDFGKVWGSVAVAISEEVELGCCGDFRWMRGDSELVLGVE